MTGWVIGGIATIALLLVVIHLGATVAGRAWFNQKFKFLKRIEATHKGDGTNG